MPKHRLNFIERLTQEIVAGRPSEVVAAGLEVLA